MTNLWTTTRTTILLVILATHLIIHVQSNDNLRVAYEWKEIDYKFANFEERLIAIELHAFKPENVVPFGIEIYQSRLFVTLPRWRDGVPASLAYLNLNDTSSKSPALTPYPNWEAHSLRETNPELVSPFRIRADRCGRLWVLDSRISSVLVETEIYGPTQLLVYDLHNDILLRRHIFAQNHVKNSSFYANLAIEDDDCQDTFAYAGDLGSPGLVVYSWKQDESWRIQHNYFHPDPLAGNYSIGGHDFQSDDGLYGLAISKKQLDGYSMLYFHPLSSTMEFAVSTKILRNKTLATEGSIYKEFKILGSRGVNEQAGASFLDQQTEVLFYTLPNLNAVACWKTSNQNYSFNAQGRVYMNSIEMVFPSDIKINDQNLWVLSNRLPEFIYGELLPNAINFRISTANVKDAIENTACDMTTKPLPEIINTDSNTRTYNNNTKTETSASSQRFVATEAVVVATAIVWLSRCYVRSF